MKCQRTSQCCQRHQSAVLIRSEVAVSAGRRTWGNSGNLIMMFSIQAKMPLNLRMELNHSSQTSNRSAANLNMVRMVECDVKHYYKKMSTRASKPSPRQCPLIARLVTSWWQMKRVKALTHRKYPLWTASNLTDRFKWSWARRKRIGLLKNRQFHLSHPLTGINCKTHKW